MISLVGSFFYKKKNVQLVLVTLACNPSTQKTEAGQQVQGEHGLHSEALSQEEPFLWGADYMSWGKSGRCIRCQGKIGNSDWTEVRPECDMYLHSVNLRPHAGSTNFKEPMSFMGTQ